MRKERDISSGSYMFSVEGLVVCCSTAFSVTSGDNAANMALPIRSNVPVFKLQGELPQSP